MGQWSAGRNGEMLTVSGILGIISEPEVKETEGGLYFSFVTISPGRKGRRDKHKVSLYCPLDEADNAKKNLVNGCVFLLRCGQWTTNQKNYDGRESVFHNLNMSWGNIDILDWFGNKE